MQNIYVVRGTEQAGPFTEADIRAQLAAGTLTGDSMVWWEGLPEWKPLSQTPLASAPAVSAPAAPAPLLPSADAAVLGVGEVKKTSTLAITSLVTGLLGFFCGFLSIAAVITGHMARKEIKKNPALSGDGLALAGMILGYIEIVLIVIVLVIYMFLGAAMLSQGVKQAQIDQAQATTNSAPATPSQ